MSSEKARLIGKLKSANDALKEGSLDAALERAREATEMDAASYEAWVVAGKVFCARGASDDAVKAYERAIGIRRDHPAAYQGLNETHAKTGDVEGQLRALSALVETHRASGKTEKYVGFLTQACDLAWEQKDWARAIGFYRELGRFRDASVEETKRIEAVRRACEAALASRDARAAEAGEAAVQMLRSTTIASKGEEAIVRKLGMRASHAVDDEALTMTLSEWLVEDAANVAFDSRTHAAEFDRLDARLAASLSAQVNCEFDPKKSARELLKEASFLVDRWGDVAFDIVSDSVLDVVAALELGLDCEEEGWDDDDGNDANDEAVLIELLARVEKSRPNALVRGWLALRSVRRSGAFAHSCRPGQPPRGEKGLLSTDLRDDMIVTLNGDDESKPSHASAALGWLALSESMLVGGEREEVHALHCAATAMKILRVDVTTEALPKTSRRVLMVHAEAMLRSGMFKPARAAFIALEGPRAMRGLAMCAYNAHPPEYDEALRLLSDAAEAYPNVRRVQVELGWLAMLAGSTDSRDRALDILERACGATADVPLSPTTPADASARLGVARWRSSLCTSKGPGSAHEALLIGAAGESPYRAAAFAHLGLSCAAAGDSARARKCHARALAIDPSDPTSGPVAFADALGAGDERMAVAVCRAALKVDSRCSWAANRLAPLCARLGDHQGAVDALQVVLRVSSQNGNAWEALGAAYNAIGRHSASLKAFARAMELGDAHLYAAAQSGHIHLTLGSSVDAIQCYEKALSDGVDRVAALFGSASAHAYFAKGALRWGAPGQAVSSLRAAKSAASRVIELMGDEATATVWKLVGDVHYLAALVNDPAHGRDYDSMLTERAEAARAATRAHERALELHHDRPARWRDVVASLVLESDICAALGDAQCSNVLRTKALERAMGYVRLDSGDPRAWLALANLDDPSVSDEAVRLERKVTALDRATALDPTFAEAWCALGRLRLSLGDVSAAATALDRARIADPSSGEAWTVTAAVHCARNNIDEGRGAFRMASQLGAGFEADLGYALASCASSPSHARDAYAAARRASEAAPADASAALALALCSEARGLRSGAVEACEQALDLGSRASASMALIEDASVVRRVAELCLQRVRDRDCIENVDTDAPSQSLEEAIRRALIATRARPECSECRRDFVLLASASSNHALVSAAARACPEAQPRGDHRVQSSIERAAAACALNATPMVGADEARALAISRACRATMLDPGHPDSIDLIKLCAGASTEETNARETHRVKILNDAVERFLAGDRTAETVVRDMRKDESVSPNARACAQLILGAFLRERFRADGDKNALKEARKVLRVNPSKTGAFEDIVTAFAEALEVSSA